LEVFGRFLIQVPLLVLLARLLTPSDFGLVAMVLVFTTLAALLADAGFGVALVQRQEVTADEKSTVFIITAVSSVVLTALLWLCAPLVSQFYAQPELTPLTRLLALVVPFTALASVPDAILTIEFNFRARAQAEILAAVSSGVVAIVLAYIGFGVWSLAWQLVIASFIRATLLWRYARWRPNGVLNFGVLSGLFRFAGFMLVANLLDTISLRLQALMIGRLYDSREVGFYTMAQTTQQAPSGMMAAILNKVGLPVFSSVADEPQRFGVALRTSLRLSMFVLFPAMICIAIVSKPLIILLYGERWLPAAPILTILAVSAAFWPIHLLNLTALNGLGRSDLSFRLSLIKKTILVCMILLMSRYGPLGIAWAVLISGLIALGVNGIYSRKYLRYGLLSQFADQGLTMLLSAGAAIAGLIALRCANGDFWGLPVSVLTSASVYLVGAYWMNHPALQQLFELFWPKILRLRDSNES
jgi:teichuronic acid exporter